MLVLSRKPGEKVVIANDITISVLSVQGNRVRIGIEAPGEYRVLRAELADWNTNSRPRQEPIRPTALPAVPVGVTHDEMPVSSWAI